MIPFFLLLFANSQLCPVMLSVAVGSKLAISRNHHLRAYLVSIFNAVLGMICRIICLLSLAPVRRLGLQIVKITKPIRFHYLDMHMGREEKGV